jgi:2-amino-4-hydroxy-6-hydroxymethyldihydropteridine diphosphokinase
MIIARPAAVEAFVGLGANLEDPLQQVRQAIAELDAIEHTCLLVASSLYRSAPVGYADQPDFINAVAKLQTGLSPRELLDALHVIENRHSRRRSVRNAPRTLDLDLLLYGILVVDEDGLTLPHPRMHERAFVLLPLAEIAPEALLPGHASVSQLLAQVDRSGVEKLHVA